MSKKYESHLTFDREHSKVIEDNADKFKMKFSAIDGDPLMGKKPYCYLTAYSTNALDLYYHNQSVSKTLGFMNIPTLRMKIEEIVFDSKTEWNPLLLGDRI